MNLKSIGLLLMLLLCCSVSVQAAVDSELLQDITRLEQEAQADLNQTLAFSEALARITGTAISPALGLGLIGLYDHANGIEHWYGTPYLYVPLLLLVFLELIKNSFGMAVFPGPLRKPLDAVFQLVGYFNAHLGLVMSVGIAYESFQPQTAVALQSTYSTLIANAHAAEPLVSASAGISTVGVLAALFGAAIYSCIWLISHTFELMVFLCPFTSIDLILKSIQQAGTTTILLLSLVFPPVAMVICLFYFLVCLLIVGYCFRFSLFGTTMLWHFVARRGRGEVDLQQGILCFAGTIEGVKSNTRGYLKRKEGQMIFTYKRGFAIPKEVPLSLSEAYVIEGFQYPILNAKPNGWGESIVVFSSMYQRQEKALATVLGCQASAGLLLSGVRGALNFVQKHFLNREPDVSAASV